MEKNEATIMFREICSCIPTEKFCLDCLVECNIIEEFDINKPDTFVAAHPILWAANTLGYYPNGDMKDIITDFCVNVLHIRKKKMDYLFGVYPYKWPPEKKDFLSRLFFITASLR